MPIRYRLLVATAGFLTLLPVSGETQQQADSPQGQAESQQSPPEAFPAAIPVEIIEDKAEAEARKRGEAEAAEREKADLIAQEGMNAATQEINTATKAMADYALWQTRAAWAGTILLVATLWLTIRTVKAGNTLLNVEIVPHLSIVCPDEKIEFLPGGSFKVGEITREPRFEIYNAGRSTAIVLEAYRETAAVPKRSPPEPITYPDIPDRGRYKKNFIVIGPGSKSSPIKMRPRSLPQEINGTEFIYFYGYIICKDIKDRHYIRGFCLVYTHEGVFSEAWPPRDPEKYNYQRRLSRSEYPRLNHRSALTLNPVRWMRRALGALDT